MGKITFNLIVGIFAVLTIIYSFFSTESTTNIFMFEVNIWIYRLVWAIIAAGCFYDHFKKTNKTME